MNKSRVLTDGALLTAVYIILLIISVFVPVISMLSTFLLPVPFVLFAFRHDWKPAVLMLFAALVLTAMFTTVFSLPIPIMVGLGGIMIGSAMHRKLTPYETWARGTIGFVLGLVFIFIFSQFVLQVNLVTELDNMIEQSMQMSQGFLKQFGLENQSEAQLEMLQQQLEMIKNLIPVFIAIIGIIMAFISQWISYKVINRVENKKLAFPPFRTLRLPVSLVWIYFFSLIFTFFGMEQSSILYLAVNNVMMLTGMFMTLQGFSFIFFFAHQKNMSKAIPVTSVVVTLLFPFLLLYLVRLLGIIDIGFSLRDRLAGK